MRRPRPAHQPVSHRARTRVLARLPAGALFAWLTLAASAATCRAWESSPNPFRFFTKPSTSRLATSPHPAVARIVVDEGMAQASGSGSLVAIRDPYGLVVTNWHVVRDAKGKIEVQFPDGFRSAATVLKTDADWDLAALLIWRPSAAPLRISHTAPQPGDPLSIAGYGQGSYQAVAGTCTQYVSPSTRHPYEIVELSAQARQGDSGGPILDQRGELAGVLFGASRGSTSGSYCGRVRNFLTGVWPDLDATPPPTAPSTPSPAPADAPLVGYHPAAETDRENTAAPPIDSMPEPSATTLVPVEPRRAPAPRFEDSVGVEVPPRDPPVIAYSPPPLNEPRTSNSLTWEDVAGITRFDQAKTILAIIGILALWGHMARWVAG